MTKLPDEVREGEVLAGKYRIEGRLGAGGMGELVAARHLLLGEKVAIKFMSGDSWANSEAVARFVQEARAAIRIHSEHVVRVLDVAVLESGVPYIVMEHLAGSDLGALLAAKGPLPVPEAVDHLLEACEAVAEAHRLGIVHRDLKPANLFLARREGAPAMVKVLDFGISKNTKLAAETANVAGSTQASATTQAGTLLGSPFHMSPEQMESARDVDQRTDIWALGVTLFELVTGKPPYEGTTLIQVYSKIMSGGPPAWRRRLRGAALHLDDVFTRCLARRRDDRYPSVDELAEALAPFGSSRARESAQRIARILARGEPDDGGSPPVASTRRIAQRSAPRLAVAAWLAIPSVVAVVALSMARLAPPKANPTTLPTASAGPLEEAEATLGPVPVVATAAETLDSPAVPDRSIDPAGPATPDPEPLPRHDPEKAKRRLVPLATIEKTPAAGNPSAPTSAQGPSIERPAVPSPPFDIKQMLEQRK
jgi:serine/threonine-protein kinase